MRGQQLSSNSSGGSSPCPWPPATGGGNIRSCRKRDGLITGEQLTLAAAWPIRLD
jgi:hypothetical protein